MPHAPRRLTIATRESALALWPAEHIRSRLTALYPGTAIALLGLTTQGDRLVDQSLSAIGGKGLFIKELEIAMEDRRADLAVHSLKDIPMEMLPGFTLAAIVAREDPRDAFVSTRFARLRDLPPGTIVGTSSLRREAQVRERYPHLRIESLRGNVNTRLRKLDEGRYGAIILAAAGLKRLGFAMRIASLLEPDESLPAPGQGALAIECRTDRPELIAALEALGDRATTLATTAERAFRERLAAVVSCRSPRMPSGKRARCGCAVSSRVGRATTCCVGKWTPTLRMPRRRWSLAASSPTSSWRAAPPASFAVMRV